MAGRKISKGHATGALILGIIEIVIGLIVTICSFVLASKAKMSAALTPYWAGLIYLIPGILGVVTGCTKGHCAMIGNMVVNIIVLVIEGIGCVLIAIVVAVWAAYADGTCTRSGDTCYCRTNDGRSVTLRGTDTCDVLKTISALLYVLVVFLVVAAIVTLAASILGCVAVCCSNNQEQPGVIIQQPVIMQQQQQQPPGYYSNNLPPKQ